MTAVGQERRIWALLGTSAVALNSDICLRRNDETGQIQTFGTAGKAHIFDLLSGAREN